jgi:type III pantothenate kinase
MILTIDIGNSRIKWAQWLAEVIIARGVAAYDESASADDIGQLLAVDKPTSVYALCVGNDRMRSMLSDWVSNNWQLDVRFLETQKRFRQVENAYLQPENHGADRWAAVVAAHHLFPRQPVCVINAGTATTVDYVDQQGRHLGGYILPSFYMMYQALTQGTAKLGVPAYDQLPTADTGMEKKADESSGEDAPFPRDTLPAITEGLHRFIKSGLGDICRQAFEKLGDTCQVVLTGGAAKTILAYPDMPEMAHKPDLVMQGLYMIMKDTGDDAGDSERQAVNHK